MTVLGSRSEKPVEQLLLPVRVIDEQLFDNFYTNTNIKQAGLIKQFGERVNRPEEDNRFVYLYGASGSGKTHLLQAVANIAERQNSLQVGFFCFAEMVSAKPDLASVKELFNHLSAYDVLLIDNLDSMMIGDEAQEQLVFNLFNAVRDLNKSLLISAKTHPDALTCHLNDLRSRLKSGLVIRLDDYQDQAKVEIITKRAHLLGLQFNEEVASYIIKRSSRNMKDLMSILSILDKSSLAEQRKLTIPFIKKVLQW